MKTRIEELLNGFVGSIGEFSTNTLNWLSIMIGHCVFIPTALALLTELTDKTPSVDIILLVQGFLILSFFRSVVAKDTVAMVLHALGWFVQATLLGMIVFK